MIKKNLLIIISLILLLFTACDSLKKAEQTKESMGTFVTITVYDEDEDKAERVIGIAFEEIERIESLVSNYIDTSEVYILNKNGEIDSADNEFIYLLGKSLKYGDISRGAFDITVQPILDLYKYTFSELERAPTDDEIKETLKLVGYEKIHIRNRRVEFMEGGMKITLGGIAKGYIIDKAIEILGNKGIEHALVNAGGDMRAIGNKGKKNWKISLQNPRKKWDSIVTIEINDTAVCTSGDYERFFDDSKNFHHIVDPRTGYSATELISVTIVADSAMDCDALATSVFVMGKEKGLELIESLHVEGLLITKEKDIIKSSGFDY